LRAFACDEPTLQTMQIFSTLQQSTMFANKILIATFNFNVLKLKKNHNIAQASLLAALPLNNRQ